MRRPAVCLFVSGLLFLAGCGGSTGGTRRATITHFPRWPYQQYERLAVLPAQYADPRAADAADRLTDRLAELLAGSGAFTVLDRSAFRDVMTEQDLSRLADVADPATALPEGRIQGAQALVITRITAFDLVAEQRERRFPRYARDSRGRLVVDRFGRPLVVAEDVLFEFTHGATVAGSVRVIDAATGRLLLSVAPPAISDRDSRSRRPPERAPEDFALAAAEALATEFFQNVAPIEQRIKLDSDMLFIALDYFEGAYDEASRVPSTLEEVLVVVRDLPKECERNAFRIAVTPRDERRNLAEFPLTWSSSDPKRGQSFALPVRALREAGGEEFVAKLFSEGDPEPILTRGFMLTYPKE
ncbi:MAG: CsgG/HfaB family protein [Phycisphaerae bacterium]